MDAWPLLTGPIISGAVGRTDVRVSVGSGLAGAVAAGVAGGPIWIAGMAGRERAAAADATGAAPTSMGRVTTTAGCAAGAFAVWACAAGECAAAACAAAACAGPGVDAGPAAGGERAGAAFGVADATVFATGLALGAEFPLVGLTSGAVVRWADFVDGALAFGAGAPGDGGEAPGPRPSFGGRCIDGASSAVLVDVASVSPLGGLPEKSLEKTLIAEHQP
jgi:hypothetical protein